ICNLDAIVSVGVSWCRHELRMNPLVGKVEEEWFSGRVPFKEVDCVVCEQIGDVCGICISFLSSIHIKLRIVINTLAAEAYPIVEALARRIVIVTHMPLADERCLVSLLLQVFWKEPN